MKKQLRQFGELYFWMSPTFQDDNSVIHEIEILLELFKTTDLLFHCQSTSGKLESIPA